MGFGCAAPVEPVGSAEPQPEEAVAQTAEPLSAGLALSIAPDASGIVPSTWEYRELSTRNIFGCNDYDILQGTGWFPATWYKTYPFMAAGDTFVVNLEHTFRAFLCAAQMDPYNSVYVERVDAGAVGGKLAGRFGVVPDGTSGETTITCMRNPSGDPDRTLTCEDAHVRLPAKGTMTVHIRFQE